MKRKTRSRFFPEKAVQCPKCDGILGVDITVRLRADSARACDSDDNGKSDEPISMLVADALKARDKVET